MNALKQVKIGGCTTILQQSFTDSHAEIELWLQLIPRLTAKLVGF
jgi:hypothetical protein